MKLKEILESIIDDNTCIFCKEIVDEDLRKWFGKGGGGGAGGGGWDRYSSTGERLGKSHWSVPGPDGHYGFGGSCFPKDINALISVAKDKLDLYPNTLIGAWETNCEVRPEKDWEQLKGRAVVDE